MDKQKSAEFLSQLKKQFNPLVETQAYIHYYDNLEDKYCEEVALNTKPPSIDLIDSQESILLDKPAFHKNGVPVFILCRTFPISLEFRPNKVRNALVEKTMSSFQLNGWLKDAHLTNLTKPRGTNSNVLYSAIFAIIAAVFITLFVTYVAWGG